MDTQTPVVSEPAQIPVPETPPVQTTPAPVTSPLTVGPDLSALGIGPQTQSQSTVVDEESGVVEMGLDDASVKAYDFDIYQGRKGYTDRISLVNPNQIFAGRVHYKAGSGYFLCQSKFTKQNGQELMTHQAECCQKLDSPRKRFATIVLQYSTDQSGNPLNPLGYQLKLWKFSPDKYELLRNINAEYPLDRHDIRVSCSEEKYQKLAIQNCKECIWRMPHPTLKPLQDQVAMFVRTNAPKALKAIGRKFSHQQLLEALGLATAPQVVGSELPLADLKDLLPTT